MATSNRRLVWRLVHSFTLKLALLALILLSVPLILYWRFVRAEEEQLALIGNAVVQTNHMLAAMLRPHFENFASEPAGALQEALAGATVGHTRVKILVRLKGTARDDFIYVASMPSLPRGYLAAERADLLRSGIFDHLAPSCDGSENLNYRFVNPAGGEEVLTAATPVHVGGDCWIVITSENAASLARTPIGRPFWETRSLLVAIVIYAISAVLVLWLFIHLWLNLRRFRMAARRIRLRDNRAVSFRQSNTIPELSGVTEDFDSLVEALVASQSRIKQAAEESSHALKAPLAVIAQAIEPIRRAVPPGSTAAVRGIHLIERSVAKLDTLVSVHRDLEDAGADFVYPVRQPMDISVFLGQMLASYETVLAEQGKCLSAAISPRVMAYANEDALEPVVENLLENAASFTQRGGVVEVQLHMEGDVACLRVLDRGPGVPPGQLGHVFERGFSFRPDGYEEDAGGISVAHQGLGLWIVKRNIEGLGGSVTARNRPRGGFEVIVQLPAED